jgi:hypothetical protein
MKWHCANFLLPYNTFQTHSQQMRQNRLFGKLYNEHLYLLYKANQLTEVSEQDLGNLQVMLKSSYITAGAS